MNLIDALKTGRPIRRKGDIIYVNPVAYNLEEGTPFFTIAEALADDWEVEEEPRYSVQECLDILSVVDPNKNYNPFSKAFYNSVRYHLEGTGKCSCSSSKCEISPNSISDSETDTGNLVEKY